MKKGGTGKKIILNCKKFLECNINLKFINENFELENVYRYYLQIIISPVNGSIVHTPATAHVSYNNSLRCLQKVDLDFDPSALEINTDIESI